MGVPVWGEPVWREARGDGDEARVDGARVAEPGKAGSAGNYDSFLPGLAFLPVARINGITALRITKRAARRTGLFGCSDTPRILIVLELAPCMNAGPWEKGS